MQNLESVVDLPEDRRSPMARFEVFEASAGSMDELAQRVANGEGLRAICKSKGLPHGRVMMWLMGDEARWKVYLNALAASGPFEMEEAKLIADESEDARLRVSVRERRAEAHTPAIYGKKTQVTREGGVVADAALVGFAVALLDRIRKPEKVIESVPDDLI